MTATDWDELRARVATHPKDICGNCRFGQLHTYSRSMAVRCARFPPTRRGVLGNKIMPDHARSDTVWPYLLIDDWCGEYERKEVADGPAA